MLVGILSIFGRSRRFHARNDVNFVTFDSSDRFPVVCKVSDARGTYLRNLEEKSVSHIFAMRYILRLMSAEYDNSLVGEEESFAFQYVWSAIFDWQVSEIELHQ